MLFSSFLLRPSKQIVLAVMLPLSIGAVVYVFLRSDSIILNQWVISWAKELGLSEGLYRLRALLSGTLPNRLGDSLPDGLWLFACTYCMQHLWHRHKGGMIWCLMPLVLALAHEFAQLLAILSGTFDWQDVGFYLLSYLLARALHHFFNTHKPT